MAKERSPNGLTKLLTTSQVNQLTKEIEQKGIGEASIARNVSSQQLRRILAVQPPRCSEKIYKKIFSNDKKRSH